MHRVTRFGPHLQALLLLLVAVGRPVSLPGQGGGAPAGEPADPATTWRAAWIEPAESAPEAHRWMAFRRTVELPAAPGRAVVRIAASDKYWLWVNGERVVFEGQLKRGPTPVDTYYDTVDVGPYLDAGTNTIAVLVWYWGRSGYSHRSTAQPGFLFEGEPAGVPVLSDGSWRARVLPAYSTVDGPAPPSALTERSIRYDARLAVDGWREPVFDDSDWPAARELGLPPTPPWNALVARPVPMWRDRGLREYERVTGLPAGAEGGVVVGHLPYNAQVTPYLEVRAPAGQEIRIRTDTYETSLKTTLEAEYVTRDGEQAYESYGWLSGHEVRYTIPPGVEVLALKYRETGYDTDFTGAFRSDDPELDALWEKARRTLYVNMRDNHMDCPDRERAQWYGDLTVQLGQVFYALEPERAPLLARKAARQLAAWQLADDALVTPVPYGRGMNSPELPLQMLSFVGRYGVWLYYLHTGDAATVKAVYPAVRSYLALWDTDADGLVEHRPGDWAWPDWGDNADYPVLENAWYALALRAAIDMAALTGATTDLPGYRARLESIEAAFRPRFWRDDHFRSAEHAGPPDDRANAMAVLAGLAREEDRAALLEVLRVQEHASPYMEKYVLEAMIALDGAAQALDRMKRRYHDMIASPLTTLWEDWAWEEWNGYNHAWSGGPLTLLSGHIAGVAPTEPGWASYTARPRMGSLRQIDLTVPTPRGPIALNLARDDVRFDALLDAPTPGTLVLPVDAGSLRDLVVNGEEVWADGEAAGSATGAVLQLPADGQNVRLALAAGSWAIQMRSWDTSVLTPDETFNLSENPVRSGRVTFHFAGRPAFAAVYTLDGRRVVDLLPLVQPPGVARWELTNDQGSRVAPGVYFLIARVGDVRIRRRLIVAY